MVYRIFGRKKHGKTEKCFEILKNCSEKQKKCFFIVPEQFSFSMEKDLIDVCGNAAQLAVEVLSFTRLCNRVFREFGGVAENMLDSAGKVLCMSRTLDAVGGELKEYKDSSKEVDFSKKLVDIAEEFSRYNISSEKLDSAIAEIDEKNHVLSSKLSDLSLISAYYKNILRSVYGTDGEILQKLFNTLDENTFFDGSDVVIDSFYGFTPDELGIIRRIISQADNTYITFCCDPQRLKTDPMFERPDNACISVSEICASLGVEYCDIYCESKNNSSGIGIIEQHFSSENCLKSGKYPISDENKAECGDSIRTVCCKDPSDEAKAASALIYKLISEENARFSDIAVCARDISRYDGLVDIIFDKAGIPYSYSGKNDVFTTPLIAYITSCLDFINTWREDSFVRILKTGLTVLDYESCSVLENYVRLWHISGKNAFCSDWAMNPRGFCDSFTESDSNELCSINEYKSKVIDAVYAFYEDTSSAENYYDICKAVYALMNGCCYKNSAQSLYDAKIWNICVRALDEIVKVYGREKLNIKRFILLLHQAIEEYALLVIPQTLDSVLIGSAHLMRSGKVKYMIFLGCNNEYFPAASEQNSVFSDSEKDMLKVCDIEISSSAKDSIFDEFFIAYNIFCEPSERLYLLYSERDSKNDPKSAVLKKSILLKYVESIFTDIKELTYPFGNVLDNITNAASLCDDMYSISADAKYRSAFKKVLSDTPELDSIFKASDIEKSDEKLKNETASKYFKHLIRSSPSRFETYVRCRFQYFNRYLLKIKDMPSSDLDRIQSGNILHKILESFVRELAQSKVDGNLMSYEQAEIRMNELFDSRFIELTHFTSINDDKIKARFLYLYNRLKTIASAIMKNLVDELSVCMFLPTDFEINIGNNEHDIPITPIDVKDRDGNCLGTMQIVGTVDRVDVYEKDGVSYVRVIDYKTGSKSFKPDEVSYGFNMQMLLYLYCIEYSKKQKYGGTVVPAGVLYIPVDKPGIKLEQGTGTKEVYDREVLSAFKGKGVLIEDKEILTAMEKDLEGRFIPARMTKNGEFDKKKSSLLPAKDFEELINKAVDVCTKLSSLMLDGDIKANPYREKLSVCSSCVYRPICRLDNGNKNIRYEFEEVL